MANVITYAKKGWHFLTKKMWEIRLDKVDKRFAFLLKNLRIFSLSVKGFNEDKCLTKATSLTFYTLFSIVPILALVFAISKGFGFQKDLEAQLVSDYSQYKDILTQAFSYANKMLETTKGGLIAGVGVVLLLWSVMNLLINIETSFNEIWEIQKSRTWYRKITDYLTMMMVGPIFLMVSGSMTVLIQSQATEYLFTGLTTVLLKVLGLLVGSLMFTLLYLILPNTKVNFRAAFVGGLFAAVLFELLKWGYITFQIGAGKFNAIYGGFAALPLFLIWVQYSWYIVLFGAELAFANQNVDRYELENEIKNMSVRYKRVIALMISKIVICNFNEGKKALTAMEIARELDLPVRLARTMINELVETNVFAEIKTGDDKEIAYQPATSDSNITIKYIIDKLDEKGINSLPISDTAELATINRLMNEMDETLNNATGKILVKDIK